jgi:hypothetical protein
VPEVLITKETVSHEYRPEVHFTGSVVGCAVKMSEKFDVKITLKLYCDGACVCGFVSVCMFAPKVKSYLSQRCMTFYD